MSRNNHNAGMHFVQYTSRVSDADAVAYLQRKEHEKAQLDEKNRFDDLNEKYDKPCILKQSEMKDSVRVNYFDKKYTDKFPMYHYNVLNAKNKKDRKLVLWVGYDIGGKSYSTGEEVTRGYYFYFTNKFAKDSTSRKLLLFKVKKQSDSDLKRAVEIATIFGKEIISSYYNNMEIEWDKPVYRTHGDMACWMNVQRIRCFRTIENCTLEIWK